ncbi:MAG: hypothetical protein VX246_17080 [Myxococcota bacterium]|nr:hypothetical protein [Myxococcota bacterium]
MSGTATAPVSLRAARGFTLLELVFVVGVTGILITAVTSIFANITSNSKRATERVREIRSAASVLDRIAGDVESAYLVRKEPDADPLFHPWIFTAESQRGFAGSDRLMFTTVAHRSDAIAIDPTQRKSAAGLATYAYFLEPDPEPMREDRFLLMRWVNPFLAEDHVFPRSDDPAAMLVAEDVATFSMRFQDDAGVWTEEWDSTLITESGELPIAVDIRLALWPNLDELEWDLIEAAGEDVVPTEYHRSVVLYQRPMMSDSEFASFVGGGGEDDSEGDPKNCNMTYAECLDMLRPNLGNEWDRVHNNNCVEDGQEIIFDVFGVQVDLTKCGR